MESSLVLQTCSRPMNRLSPKAWRRLPNLLCRRLPNRLAMAWHGQLACFQPTVHGKFPVLQTCSRPMNRSVSEGVAQVAKPAVSQASKPACRGLWWRVDRYFPVSHGEASRLTIFHLSNRFMESSLVLQTCSRPMNRSVSEGVAQVAKPAVASRFARRLPNRLAMAWLGRLACFQPHGSWKGFPALLQVSPFGLVISSEL